MTPTLILVAIAAITFLLVAPFLVWRLRRASDNSLAGPDQTSTYSGVFGGVTAPLASVLPVRDSMEQTLQKDLWRAGFYHPTALLDFAALRALLTLFPLFFFGGLALLDDNARVPLYVIIGIMLSGVGFLLPRLYLNSLGNTRAEQLERGLPLLIDSLVLCLSAGQNLSTAFQMVTHQVRRSFPILADELALVLRQTELFSLEYALMQWAERAQVPSITSFAYLLAQTERYGTNASTALTEFATSLQTTLRQRAETLANRTSFWLTLPTVFCFLVASAIALVGPGLVELINEGSRAIDIANEATAGAEREGRQRPSMMTPQGWTRTGGGQQQPVTTQPVESGQ